MNIIYVFVMLAVSVKNCYPAKSNSCDFDCGRSGNQRAIGDKVTSLVNKYPWTVGVYRSEYLLCTGSLVTNKHVLLSQYCAHRVEFSRDELNKIIEIRLGDNANNTVKRGLFTVYRHENYKFEKPDNDIAILQLDQAVPFGFSIQPICLPESQSVDYSEKLVTSTGWYDIIARVVGEEEAQTVLKSQGIQVPIWTNEDCAKIPHYAKKLTNKMICAGEFEDGVRHACFDDLDLKYDQIFIERKNGNKELVGIYTFGTRCGTVGVPAVYIRVASYLPWIQSVLKDYKCEPKSPSG